MAQEATPEPYQWYQCENESCRFRCPALLKEMGEPRCPLCKTGRVKVQPPLPTAARSPETAPVEGGLSLLLDNIRSIYNVGAMFRTADGAGLDRLYCCGMSATPEHPRVAKTALGAQEAVHWQYRPNAWDTAAALQHAGWQIWALERGPRAVNLFDAGRPASGTVLVVGNERAGVDPAIVEIANRTVALPMHGMKASLNAAVATGIALYVLKFG